MELQGHVEVALKDSPTATEFIERLQVVGVETIPFIKDGRAIGVSFRKDKQLMKGSNLGRGFSWNALQERGLDYHPERDRTAIEAARQRADAARTKTIEGPALNTPTLDAPMFSTPAPEHSLADIAKDAGRIAGQYLLDQINPVKQLEDQARTFMNASKAVVDGYNFARDLLSQQNAVEQLQQAAGLEQPSGRDALERLHQSAGLETTHNMPDALERLNELTGVTRDEPALVQELDRTLEQSSLTPTLEPVLEEEIAEHVMEHTLDILMF